MNLLLKNMKISPIAIFWALLTFVVHLVVAKNYEPHRDELLYLTLGQHLDWGFASVPPFIGFLAKLSGVFFTDIVFGAKFWAALFGALTVIVVALITELLTDKRGVLWLSCAAVTLAPVSVATAQLFQPVVFDIFFWTLSGYFFIKMLKTDDPSVWLPLGASWAIGFLNKYNIVFMVVSCIIALLLTPQRKLIFSKQFLYATVLGLLIISPNLYWQYQHGFPVFHHMKELSETQLVNVKLSDFFFNQILMHIHAFVLWVFGLWAIFYYKKERFLLPLALMFLVAMGFFVLGRAKSYYTLGLYPMFLAVGACMIERYWVKTAQHVALIGVIIIPLPLLPIGLPVFSHEGMVEYFKKVKPYIGDGFLRWETGKVHDITQDYADMTGWQEMTDLVEKAYLKLSDAEKKNCLVYGENYGQASAVAILNKNKEMPYPISFSDNYVYWLPDNVDLQNLVLIRINDEEGDIGEIFNKFEVAGEMTNIYARERGSKIWVCKEPKPVFAAFYKEKLQSIKEKRKMF